MPHTERLIQLHRVVQATPEHRLHMHKFHDTGAHIECGTAHCAAGWAANDPWFQEQEFSFATGIWPDITSFANHDPGFDLGTFFGISEADAINLFALHASPIFSDPHSITKAEVLANIDRLLSGEPTIEYPAIAKQED